MKTTTVAIFGFAIAGVACGGEASQEQHTQAGLTSFGGVIDQPVGDGQSVTILIQHDSLAEGVNASLLPPDHLSPNVHDGGWSDRIFGDALIFEPALCQRAPYDLEIFVAGADDMELLWSSDGKEYTVDKAENFGDHIYLEVPCVSFIAVLSPTAGNNGGGNLSPPQSPVIAPTVNDPSLEVQSQNAEPRTGGSIYNEEFLQNERWLRYPNLEPTNHYLMKSEPYYDPRRTWLSDTQRRLPQIEIKFADPTPDKATAHVADSHLDEWR